MRYLIAKSKDSILLRKLDQIGTFSQIKQSRSPWGKTPKNISAFPSIERQVAYMRP